MDLLVAFTNSAISSKPNTTLILAIVWIINKDFAKYTTSSVVISQYSSKQTSLWYHNDLMNAVLMHAMSTKNLSDSINTKLIVLGDNFYKDIKSLGGEESRYGYKERGIFFVDSLRAYMHLEKDLLDSRNEYYLNGYYCIIYTGTEIGRLSNIKTIFHRLFDIYMTNVNVVLIVGDAPYVYTYFPFSKNRCHSSTPEYYLSFRSMNENDNFQLSKPLFPDKAANMLGCKLVIVTWSYKPYIIMERDPITNEVTSFHGIEGRLLSLIAEKMNFSMNFVEPPLRERGYDFKNGTITGATKMIVEGNANITIVSYIYEKGRIDSMEPSHSYMSFPLVLGVPVGEALTPFERLIRPFKYIIWSCLSSSICLGILTIYGIKLWGRSAVMNYVFGRRNRTPFTNLWNSLLGGTIPGRLPRRNFARYLLGIWLLYTLVLRSAYVGELFILLQDGRAYQSLSTVKELVEKNYTFYSVPTLDYVLTESIKTTNKRYVDSRNNTLIRIMERLHKGDEKLVLILFDATAKTYNQNRSLTFSILPEKLFTSPLTMYMRHHSYLKKNINEFILMIQRAGIMEKFINFYIKKKKKNHTHEPATLSLWILFGLFTVYFVLLCFAILIFLLELWSAQIRFVSKLINFLNY